MSYIKVFTPFDMSDAVVWTGEVVKATEDTLIISDGTRTGRYDGVFEYDADGNATGTIQKYTYFEDGELQIRLKGLAVDAAAYGALFNDGDAYGIYELLFAGKDNVVGSDGADIFWTYGGSDNLDGGAGSDMIDGMGGNDTIRGGLGADSLYGGAGRDVLFGDEGNDFLHGGIGADRMLGGLGNDRYVVDNVKDAVVEGVDQGNDLVRASVDYALGANVERLVLAGTEALRGTGNELDNVLTGNAGNNVLRGGAGEDTLAGGAGNDFLNGGEDADRMVGGAGNDRFVVDNAGDVVVEARGQGNDLVSASVDFTLGANVERLVLTGSGDLEGRGNGLANSLSGNSGDNILRGGAGADTMLGGGGADRLFGGAGADQMTGNAGADLFVFRTAGETPRGTGHDVITDFEDGLDRLHLAGIDADTTSVGNQAFDFIGSDVFSGTAGELRYGYHSIFGDVDGDGNADFQIEIGSGLTLTTDDFIL